MKRFNSLVNEVYAKILEQETVPAAIPQTGGPVTPTTAGEQPPAPAPEQPAAPEQPVQEPKPLTSEGKVFLIDYIRKALAIDPGTLTPDEKAVFNEPEVNSENGEEILNRLQEIINSRQ
jgi:hypothetical protein